MTVYWGVLEKEAGNTQTVDQAIAYALANYEYFKTISVWGLLPKSAIDATTIEDRINELIAVHEASATAHLGAGESLESHKSADIIDHPAGSLLADKSTRSEYVFYTEFENSARFIVVGSPTFFWPGFVINGPGANFAGRYEVAVDGQDNGLNLKFTKDFLVEISTYILLPGDGTIKLRFGYPPAGDTVDGVGITIINGTFKCYVATEGGTNYSDFTWEGFTDDKYYKFTIQYVDSENKVYFYANGLLLGSLTYPSTSQSDPLQFRMYGYGDVVLNVYDLKYALTI